MRSFEKGSLFEPSVISKKDLHHIGQNYQVKA